MECIRFDAFAVLVWVHRETEVSRACLRRTRDVYDHFRARGGSLEGVVSPGLRTGFSMRFDAFLRHPPTPEHG